MTSHAQPQRKGASVTNYRLILRYYLSMLSLAVLVLSIGVLSAVLTEGMLHFRDALLSLILVLVVINLIGSYCIISPIVSFFRGRNNFELAQRRIQRLPLYCAVWAITLTLVALLPHHFSTHVLCADCPIEIPLRLVVYQVFLIFVYGTLLALYIYFLISDFTVALRKELSLHHGLVFEPGKERFVYKLLIAFVATSIVPIVLVFTHDYMLGNMDSMAILDREPHIDPSSEMGHMHMPTVQAFRADIIFSMVLALLAIVFISRSLTRPMNMLLETMKIISKGDLDTKAPVVSDEEIGVLTRGFNDMVDEVKDREFVRETFGRFVPESVAAAVLKDRGVIRPQVREATILTSDIENFTGICEGRHPEQVIAMLNEYFSVIAEPIREYDGVITQFWGDAILATFNLPVEESNHAINAVLAAQDMQILLERRRFEDDIALHTRIGINTGTVVGGTVGDGDRVGYTLYGESVNLAARLQELNKQFNTRVLVSARTVELTKGRFEFNKIGEVSVRGLEATITVYSLPIPHQRGTR
jgi:class 3 adenylate cyclase